MRETELLKYRVSTDELTMPYGRRPRRTLKRRRTTYRKRTLSRKAIRKNTGARAQSKQIATLSRQVKRLNATQHETIRTHWQRNNLPVETLATPGYPYMCPIPYAAMDPNDFYNPGTGITTQWTDTLAVAAQPVFTKDIFFGCSDAALNTGTVTHMGGTLKYQLSNNDEGFRRCTIALLSLKTPCADQKTIDNELRARTAPPYGPSANTAAPLRKGTDYVIHSGAGSGAAGDTSWGCIFNKQYWNVHYQRDCAFGHIGADGIQSNASSANTNPLNNALVATGTIKIPGTGDMKSFATKEEMGGAPAVQNALELGLYDERQEKAKFLVVISNGISGDNEGLFLGFHVVDYYKAVV